MLWSEILDGLGFTSNREPMRELARRVPLASIEALLQAVPGDDRAVTAMGVLLGAAGFLPLSPQEAHLGRLSVGHQSVAWKMPGEREGIPGTSIPFPLPPGTWPVSGPRIIRYRDSWPPPIC